MGDIGGVISAIYPLCAVVVMVFEFRGSFIYLASDMTTGIVSEADSPTIKRTATQFIDL